ncbi:MAG TPA: saccharopine dehydrogenase NADP-binding domain-containing protein [Longimicrobiaceae bacterium]|nr:saccharopine dehydrogenase NADP-binding domain-containing protein [Longimicrobiaceae bacterium]
MSTGRIVVVGATGYTGRLVAAELPAAGMPFVLSGRDAGRLERLAEEVGGAQTQLADVQEPRSLQRLVRAGDVVINCAGPFTELGEPVVRACVEAGAHYLDTTGEQRFMERTVRRYDGPARSAGVVVVNAMAFEYSLGDCAAAVAAEGLTEPLRSVDVTYAWHGGSTGASRGTQRSALRILGERGYAYTAGRLRRERTARKRRRVRLTDGKERSAVSFPFGEVLTVPRHQRVERVRGWMVVGRRTARMATLLSPVLQPLVRLATPLLDRFLGRGPEGPSLDNRQASSFLVLAEAVDAEGRERRVVVQGHDPYGLTAAIAVEGAARVLDAARSGKAGVLTPAQVLEPRAFLDGLATRGVEWREEAPSS